MSSLPRNQIILLVSGIFLLALVVWFWLFLATPISTPTVPEPEVPIVVVTPPVVVDPKTVIGTSVDGRAIESYTFGTGSTTLLFVGGVHGGYEWNSVLVAYEMIDELTTGVMLLPAELSVVIIPALNPDGLFSVVGKEGRFTADEIPENTAHVTGQGRLNAHDVDLNRNFDCKWQPKSTWRSKTVNAGSAAFSEPEAEALRVVVTEIKPSAVVFWHSQAGAVYASECEAGILPETLTLMEKYAAAGQYLAITSFDAYPITGDAEGWLASLGIPAITVELETRESAEWSRNKAGITEVFTLYTK